MKTVFFAILLLILSEVSYCQKNHYWQQEVNYNINVSLNDTTKSLDGTITLNYTNHSTDTLPFIWFHLWPNAYKNDQSAFSEQLLENNRTDFYFSIDQQKGYINQINFSVDGKVASIENHPKYQDVVKLLLPSPLLPGMNTTITTPFHVKLPYNFSRGGYHDDTYQITQWYPKPAVYDRFGWHEMPYLDQGEFYSEFGTYDVTITTPKKLIIAATGNLIDSTSTTFLKTYHFVQNNIHDFAWFADKDFILQSDTVSVNGAVIKMNAYHHRKNNTAWKNAMEYIRKAILSKSDLIGPYPYNIVSVVESPQPEIGGMEYPTIALVENTNDSINLKELIIHEVGHNWFYGILASNERTHPWMDEGMNTYYDKRFNDYFSNKTNNNSKKTITAESDLQNIIIASICKIKKDQPIETPSDQFTDYNYAAIAYNKTAQWMKQLENKMGRQTFDSMMHSYFEKWKFKHPYPIDFKNITLSFNQQLDADFNLMSQKGNLTPVQKRKIKLGLFFQTKDADKYNYINFSPTIGYNTHDKLMFGGILHNYSLLSSNFQFVAVPLYSATTKQFNGIGRLSYNSYPGSNGQNLEFSASASSFTNEEYLSDSEELKYLRFTKLVPAIKYTFGNKNVRSKINNSIEWKSYFINDHSSLDEINATSNRYINQLKFTSENNRTLYPYQIELMAEQGPQFVKLNVTGNYFFNYVKGGGLTCRLFAGKFFYTSENTFLTQFETERYHYNMTGSNGYQDYIYNDYFLGRNNTDGLGSQQIRIKDGGFKLNINNAILFDKIAVTDDWLMAINLCTTIPKQISILKNIPIKLFADFGTYAGAWKEKSSSEKILYDAGIQLSLLGNVVNVYIPILYSNTFKNYFDLYVQENQFMKNISFSIDLQNIKIKNLFTKMYF